MQNLLIAITFGLTFSLPLAACGGENMPPEKQMTNKELAAAAVVGDKDTMRELERQVAKKSKDALKNWKDE